MQTTKRWIFQALAVSGLLLLTGAAIPANAAGFAVRSPDVSEGATLAKAQVYSGYGCTGGNESPAVQWTDPPAGTKSFAFTVFDPDAPTGHGWWHWIVFDIPATASGLPGAAGKSASLPKGSRQANNDFEVGDFGGACPPAGDKPHRYQFTVYALKVEHLDVPPNAKPQSIESSIHASAIGSARITARYSR